VPSSLADVWFKVTDLEVESGSGALVTTVDGTEYLDFTSGIGVANTGHCHPTVVNAVREQVGRLLHAQMNVYRHPLAERLAARLGEITPGTIERFFFSNSGAEAVESGVKLARQATGRPNVVVFQGSFHGRTAQAMAMTTCKTTYRSGHEPLPSGVFVAPFPDPFHSGEDPRTATRRCLDELDLMLLTQTAPEETAAMFIEPVLGEGGYLPAPKAFLEGVANVCRRHEILLVVDEIQTGFGRTGRFFACEEYGIEPDILVMAKGMASGFPMSAIGASAELMAKWPQGSHGGTYGGNPIGCTAALATIEVLSEPGFLEAVRDKGRRLVESLTELQRADVGLGDVRGMGLMVGCAFVDADRRPDPGRTKAVARHMLEEARVILMSCGPHGNVLRWIPPLVATNDQLDVAVKAFAAALETTTN
jgi:4-aminobutyrate aminotransferase